MNPKCFCWVGLGVYALLSVGDWLLTHALLHAEPGAVESNPVAAAFLENHGWGGLALFKTAAVVVFVTAVVLILRRQPLVAAGVVSLGCAALLWVTTHSHGLLIRSHREAAELARTEWPRPKATDLDGNNVFGVPERCWFAEERTTPTRTAATPRGRPLP